MQLFKYLIIVRPLSVVITQLSRNRLISNLSSWTPYFDCGTDEEDLLNLLLLKDTEGLKEIIDRDSGRANMVLQLYTENTLSSNTQHLLAGEGGAKFFSKKERDLKIPDQYPFWNLLGDHKIQTQ